MSSNLDVFRYKARRRHNELRGRHYKKEMTSTISSTWHHSQFKTNTSYISLNNVLIAKQGQCTTKLLDPRRAKQDHFTRDNNIYLVLAL